MPEGIGRIVQERADAYFIGKDPLDIELHNAQFFQKQKASVRLFFLVKLRMHHDRPADDLKLVAAVREAVGDKMAIMVDANQAGKTAKSPPPVWDYGRALAMAKELEQMSVFWLEEPLNRDALDDLARLRKQLVRMHLAGAEGDVGLERFRRILSAEAFSYLQPDPMIGGGVSVIRKIAALAGAFGVLFGPHHGKSGVGMLADLHMQCAAPNSGYLEYMCICTTRGSGTRKVFRSGSRPRTQSTRKVTCMRPRYPAWALREAGSSSTSISCIGSREPARQGPVRDYRRGCHGRPKVRRRDCLAERILGPRRAARRQVRQDEDPRRALPGHRS